MPARRACDRPRSTASSSSSSTRTARSSTSTRCGAAGRETLARLASRRPTGRPIATRCTRCSATTRDARHGPASGGLAATPMARLRERDRRRPRSTRAWRRRPRERRSTRAWHAPDPVELARPVTDLPALLGRLRATGRRLAVATSDDREPDRRTLDALGVDRRSSSVVCADDGVAVKPAPDDGPPPVRGPRRGARPDRRGRRFTGRLAHGTGGRCRAGWYGVLTGVGGRADLEPLADVVLDSVEALVGG